MINRKPVRKEGKAMTRRLKLILLAAVFIGGFASLSLELIIVVVIMDFMAQVQTHMMSHQYGDVLRKANLKGYGR